MDFHPESSVRWDVSLHSRDVEEARGYLEVNGFTLGIDARQVPCLDMRTFGVRLPGIYIAYMQYGAPVTVRATPGRDDYCLLSPVRGTIEAGESVYDLCCDPRRAVAFSYPSTGSGGIRAEANSARIIIKMTPTAINRELTALLGNPPSAPLELAPAIDLTQGYGRSLAGHLGMALSDFIRGDSLLRNPIAVSSFEHFVLSALLMSHPHNYSDALRRLERPITPRAVKRAIDYIEAHLNEPITLANIVHASGVPGRTLFKHFKEYRGVSPMRYLRTARFESVRDELRRCEPEMCVTDVAIRWGFEHMGRFAVEYRKRFGESPSQTLGKRRRRR